MDPIRILYVYISQKQQLILIKTKKTKTKKLPENFFLFYTIKMNVREQQKKNPITKIGKLH